MYVNFIPKEYRKWDILVWFETDELGVRWVKDYQISVVKDARGEEVYEFTQDFTVSGKVCYSVGYNQESVETSYYLTLRAYRYADSYTVEADLIDLWTKEKKILTEYSGLLIEQYDKLGLKDLEHLEETGYGSFTGIWTKGDKTNIEQTEATSYYYYREIIDAYDQLRFCVGNVNAYMPYTSNYLAKERRMEGRVFYDINLAKFDRRYLYFCGFAFEKLYSFWERIAFLAYQFIKPKGLSTPQNLSFSKFIVALRKDCNNGLYPYFLLPNSSYHWFSEFEKEHHQPIQTYRHPLIHYKHKNEIYKGSFFAGTYSYWMQNSFDREKLEELQQANENLGVFLIEQTSFCKTGIQNLIALIKELP